MTEMFTPIVNEDTLYLEISNGARAIIRDGDYIGWYDPNLPVVLD